MDTKLEAMDTKIEAMDKKIEAMGTKIISMDVQSEQIVNILAGWKNSSSGMPAA